MCCVSSVWYSYQWHWPTLTGAGQPAENLPLNILFKTSITWIQSLKTQTYHWLGPYQLLNYLFVYKETNPCSSQFSSEWKLHVWRYCVKDNTALRCGHDVRTVRKRAIWQLWVTVVPAGPCRHTPHLVVSTPLSWGDIYMVRWLGRTWRNAVKTSGTITGNVWGAAIVCVLIGVCARPFDTGMWWPRLGRTIRGQGLLTAHTDWRMCRDSTELLPFMATFYISSLLV